MWFRGLLKFKILLKMWQQNNRIICFIRLKKINCINQYTIIKKLRGSFWKMFLVVNEFGEKRVIKKIKKVFGKIKGDKIESVILSET